MKDSVFRVRSLHAGAVTAVDACSGHSFPRHVHEEFGVGLVTGGAQRSWSGRGSVEAVAGNLITVNPGEPHDGEPIGGVRSWSMLYLAKPLVVSAFADIGEARRSEPELEEPVLADPRLLRLFLGVRRAAVHPAGAEAFEERLLALLERLLNRVEGSNRGRCGAVSRAVESIDDAPTLRHPLSELAEISGLSRYQTVRAFVRLTGLTPHAYVMQRRVDLARRLIRVGGNLADVAIEAGFADQSHMHRVFAARHGFTPGAYAAAVHPRAANSSKSRADPRR